MVNQVTVAGDQVILGRNGALVSSKSQPGAWHLLRDGTCDCKGFAYRGTCRHLVEVAELTSQRRAVVAEVASWFE